MTTNAPHLRARLALLALVAALFTLAGLPGGPARPREAAAAGAYAVFLPSVAAPGTPPPPPPSGGTSARWLPYRAADGTPIASYGASIAVDPAGGLHAAYAIYAGTDGGARPAMYASCPSSCGDAARWSFVKLGAMAQEARLALDPAGRPRVMLFGPVDDPGSPFQRYGYHYAECNAGCTDPASWTITTVATPIEAVGTREDNNNRYFAADGQGGVGLVYTDTAQNNHPGTFYLHCAASCAEPGSWSEAQLYPDIVNKPALEYAADGRPRLLFSYPTGSGGFTLYYAACEAGCADGGAWSTRQLGPVDGTATFALRVTAGGAPRAALYTGNTAEAPLAAGTLYYLWCADDCGGSGGWSVVPVGLPQGTGKWADLALDSHGMPRVAYASGAQGLGYAWCAAACESDAPDWRAGEVESFSALSSDFEVLPIQRCTVSAWFNGQRPSLALDAQGRPRIAYDAQHAWYGVQLGPGGGAQSCNITDITVTRVAIVN